MSFHFAFALSEHFLPNVDHEGTNTIATKLAASAAFGSPHTNAV